MIILLLHLLAWIPAIVGYGSVLLFVRRRISSIPDVEFEITEPWFGIIVLATISSFLNFFFPVTKTVAALLLLLGWGLCWYRFAKLDFIRSHSRGFVLAVLWMVLVSFWSAQQPINHDTGLYHYPSIRWINDNPLPFGLANLHGRFGFNSLWFPLAAVLQVPLVDARGTHCFSVSALLIYFFGIAVARAFAAIFAKPASIDNIFLSLSVLILLGNVFRRNISSPSPDFAILLLCVSGIYLALQTIQTASDWMYKCFQIIVLSVFGLSIKLSFLPLLLVPSGLILFGLKKKLHFSVQKLTGYSLLFSGTIMLIWLARGIILSGCLVFPVPQSCFQNLSWTVPASTTISYNSLIRLHAQYHVPPQNVTAWDWLRPWFNEQLSSSIDFVLSLGLLFAGLILLMLIKPVWKEVVWLVVSLIAGILFWFFTAPDMRFGAGYFWSLALLILSTAIQGMQKASSEMRKILAVVLFSIILILVIPLRSYLYFGLPPFRRAIRNVREFLFVLPIPTSKTETQFNSDGIPVLVPVEGEDCWIT
jgi:hypothetical protein